MERKSHLIRKLDVYPMVPEVEYDNSKGTQGNISISPYWFVISSMLLQCSLHYLTHSCLC